jgi:hypothetical protein
MYYWMPADFKDEEATGVIKNQFYNAELRTSYQEAF